jgi:peptidoglycan/LPS O-acetylase OafA/YrhL
LVHRKSHESRNFGLDLLRAAAITMVLASHLLRALQMLGIYGVELFFVLSGFLIGGILVRSIIRLDQFGSAELVRFWIRRWFRTIPNYYWFLLLYLAAAKTPATAKQLWSYAVFVQNFAWPIFPFATHTWSLTIEEWFYLLFPAALFLAVRGTADREIILTRFLYVTGFFILAPTVLRFTQPYWLGHPDARMIVVSRLDAIMYGVVLAYLKAKSARWPQLHRFSAIGLLGIAASIPLLRSQSNFAQALAFTVIPPSFAVILPALERWSKANGRVAGFIENISVWSYSIYLSHMLIYTTAMRLTGYAELPKTSQAVIKVVVLVAVIGLSALNYKFFERPMMDLRERFKGGVSHARRASRFHPEATSLQTDAS